MSDKRAVEGAGPYGVDARSPAYSEFRIANSEFRIFIPPPLSAEKTERRRAFFLTILRLKFTL